MQRFYGSENGLTGGTYCNTHFVNMGNEPLYKKSVLAVVIAKYIPQLHSVTRGTQ